MDPRISTDTREFQLEIFTGKVYEPIATGPRRDLESMTEGKSQPWRLVLPEKAWPAKPVFRARSRALPCSVTDGSTVRINATMQAYLAWAQRKGVPSLTFYDDPRGKGYARACGKPVRFVSPADFLGAAPAAELEA